MAHPARYAVTPVVPQGGGYAYRRTITIDHSKVPNTDQSNFPVLISGTYSYLATVSNGGNVQNANGYDEFIHLAGGANQNGAPIYNDYVLADAVRRYTGAPGYPSGPAPRTREEQDRLRSDTGDYWDNQLWEHCNPLGARKK